VLVKPNQGLSESELGKIVGTEGGRARKLTASGLYVVELPGNASEKAVAARLAHNPHLKFAELDKAVAGTFVPNDPYLGSQWHTAKINAPTAWDLATGVGVTIGIADTGVEATHPDLIDRLVAGYNFHDGNTDTSPVTGHGTWVSGTAAATLNNGQGVAAVAGGAKIMPLRVTDTTGYGYWSEIASSITYAADRGVRVISLSFETLLPSAAVMDAAAYMKSKNGLVVIAAGNSGGDPGYARNSNVIAVSATEADDTLASFSSYGSYVTISAPGRNIYTTGLGGTYTQGYGTSFSTPIVAGTVALMMSANPKLANTEIEKLLYANVDDLGTAGWDKYFGYGRVNAGAAVKAAAAAVSTADTQAPSVSIAAPLGSSTVSGVVAVSVSASDNVGVAKVELRVNGSLLTTETVAPFSFSWDSTKVANGMSSLTARACDAAGNCTDSATVAVNVSNTVPVVVTDTTPPSVSLTSPTASATVNKRGSLSITATASDNMGTSGLKQALYIDNKLMTTVSGGSLSYSWNLNKVTSGAHTIKVVATDAAGNSASAGATVTATATK
jgi:subtilisin family serine protease